MLFLLVPTLYLNTIANAIPLKRLDDKLLYKLNLVYLNTLMDFPLKRKKNYIYTLENSFRRTTHGEIQDLLKSEKY